MLAPIYSNTLPCSNHLHSAPVRAPSYALESPVCNVWRPTAALPSPKRTAGALSRLARDDEVRTVPCSLSDDRSHLHAAPPQDRGHTLWTRAVTGRARAGPYASHVRI
ncbi:uncharacterized protein LAESUDRAFT_726297 [Laetiporus sulphureus 93-53]|uniref:Uncharacterized protein n=1 Tax=Laetiporus sulphureus 93-53 TaxID=1314785 RepID=A0A165E1X1_9APHY|nr:uncharacterized protein LAESUDRAFT_726297 [Laetiporus sulphureus 93-53]KZT06085.1 hypothetical protein LAESUDRAFT_726297 [Laetiporus sulphureus 93-53]